MCGQKETLANIQGHVNQCMLNPPAPQTTTAIDLTGDSSSSSSSNNNSNKNNSNNNSATTYTSAIPKSLTSTEQVSLLQRTLSLVPSSPNYRPDVVSIFHAIKQHVDAEEREDNASRSIGSYQWEYYSRNRTWVKFSESENISIESDRRSGKTQAEIIQTVTGTTIVLNFSTMMDSRNCSIRAAPVDSSTQRGGKTKQTEWR